MTASQIRRYRATWANCCKEQGWNVNDDARRAAVTRAAIGRDKSSTAFTNRELDHVLKELRKLAGPVNLAAQIEAVQYEQGEDPGETRRLLHTIDRLSAAIGQALDRDGGAYIESCVTDLHDSSLWRELPVAPLTNLRNLLRSRLSRIVSHIKAGQLPNRPGWDLDQSNDRIIDAVVRTAKPPVAP